MNRIRKLRPYSTDAKIGALDKRTREYKLMAKTQAEILAQLGDKPTTTQRMMAERAARLRLRLAQLDQKIFNGGTFTEFDNNQYLAWSNGFVRTLEKLGIESKDTKQAPNIASLFASMSDDAEVSAGAAA